MQKRAVLEKISLVLIDAGVILFSLVFSFWFRFESGLIPYGHELPGISAYLKLSLVVLPLWLVMNFIYKLYNSSILNVGSEEYRRVVHTSALGMVLILVVSFLLRKEYARGWVLISWIMITVLMLCARFIMRKIKHRQNARGLNTRKTIIIGSNEEAIYIFNKINASPWLGLEVVGFVGKISNAVKGFNLLGTVEEIEKVVKNIPDIQAAVLVASDLSSSLMQDVCRYLSKNNTAIYISPSLLNIISSRITVQPIAGMPLISIEQAEFRGFKLAAKRLLDLVLTAFGMVILLPLSLLIGVLIKLDSKGPVLFKQERVGRKGRPFMMYKFRTMYTGAESSQNDIKHLNEKDGLIFKIKDDPRITRVGKILRKLSIDELAQLINVIKGDMSLVGPRPLPLSDLEKNKNSKFYEWESQRYGALPGITGLWQVSGRSELPFEEMVKLDIYYIENWSPLFDMYIMLKTIPVIMKTEGAC